MSDDQLPDELAALFAAERTSPAGDPEARAKIHARLAGVVSLLPAKAAAATTGTTAAGTTATSFGIAGKIISIVVLSVGIGVVATTVVKESGTVSSVELPAGVLAPVDAWAPQETLQVVQREPTPDIPAAVVAAPARVPPTRVAPTVSARATAPTPVAPPLTEATLLRRAWAALANNDAPLSLALVGEAEQLHPNGALVEERTALRIQVLAKLGSLADARSAAETFITQFPHSVHRTRIERAVSSEESP